MNNREAKVERLTKETNVRAELKLDGTGLVEVQTGIGFFNHLLTSAMVHGFFDLKLAAQGDTHVDDHHTVEDAGIVLGQAFNKCLGDFSGIRRFGEAAVPMEEALARVAVDLSRRVCLVFEVPITTDKVGNFDSPLVEEFWRAFAANCGANLHIEAVGRNMHHVFEALFKAAGRALDMATSPEPRTSGVISTKGAL